MSETIHTEIKSRVYGKVGNMAQFTPEPGNVLIFQVPRVTSQMSPGYRAQAQKALQQILPDGIEALIVGSDVNVLEITGEHATILRMQGKL